MFKCGSIIFYANNIDDNYIIKIIRSLQIRPFRVLTSGTNLSKYPHICFNASPVKRYLTCVQVYIHWTWQTASRTP